MSDPTSEPSNQDKPRGPSPEQIEALMRHIERIERKRKIMLGGYLGALLLLVGGQVGAFFVYATAPPGKFVGWVFLIPFALVGSILWGFGRWARAQKK